MPCLILVLLFCLSLSAADKKITSLAGNGQINNPYGLTIGPDGALYVCEIGNHVIRRIDVKTGGMQIVAGTGKPGYSGDGGLATEALLNEPYEIRFDRKGDMFLVEMKNHLIRKVDRKSKRISTLAGNGQPGFEGDGGALQSVQFKQPHSIVFDREGRLLVCDIGNNRIRRIDLARGSISTIFTGEKGKPANGPRAVDVAPDGKLYVAFREGNSIAMLDGETLTPLAGNGEKGYSGDGGPALQAKLSGPKGVALSPDGGLYIADTESHTIRRIDLKTKVISTVAGTGERGNGPDGDPKHCKMNRPHGIFVDKKGVVYIGDSESHCVRVLR
ncbi:MAG: SMP-30/gluconolactonase/LRE family protein [Bryobacteraceae bacterium]